MSAPMTLQCQCYRHLRQDPGLAAQLPRMKLVLGRGRSRDVSCSFRIVRLGSGEGARVDQAGVVTKRQREAVAEVIK